MITVKKLIEELQKCDPEKEVAVRKYYIDGYGNRPEQEIMAGAKTVDSVEEFDGRVLIWTDI